MPFASKALVEKNGMWSAEGRRDDAGEGYHVQGHPSRGAGDREENPGTARPHLPGLWSKAPRSLRGSQLAIELHGALEALSANFLLAGFGHASGP